MKQFQIEHCDGGRWLWPYGWCPDRLRAFRWPTHEQAEQHRRERGLAEHRVVPLEADDERRPDVTTDYNPYGFGVAR